MTRVEKRAASRVLTALLLLSTWGCAKPAAPKHRSGYESLVLRHEAVPGMVSPAELAEDLGYLAPVRLEYIGNSASGPHNLQAVLTGDVDFGGSFNGAIIKLVAAKAPIKAVVAAYGADQQTWYGFFVNQDSPIREAKDLVGSKIAMNTLGAHTEFLLKEYLLRGGVTAEQAKQVTLVVVPPSNGEQTLRHGQVEVSALGSIFKEKAVARGGLRLLFSDIGLLGEFTAGSYVMSDKFLKENPNTARKFAEAVGRAFEWERSTPREQVIARFQKIIAQRKRNEDPDAIQYWKSPSVSARNGVLSDRDFQVWIDWLVREGQLKPAQLKPRDIYVPNLQGSSAS